MEAKKQLNNWACEGEWQLAEDKEEERRKLQREPCGCKIIFYGLMSDMGGEIKFCPLHEAAGEMLKALQAALKHLAHQRDGVVLQIEVALKEVIAKAKGEK